MNFNFRSIAKICSDIFQILYVRLKCFYVKVVNYANKDKNEPLIKKKMKLPSSEKFRLD